MKKFSAILLAVIMMLSFSAMAASITITPPNANGGSETGITYTAYKIFDATISGTNVSYTIESTSPYFTTIQAATDYFTLTKAAGSDTTYVVTVKDAYTDSAANSFADTLKGVEATAAGTLTKQDDGNYKLGNLVNGYYLVTSSVGSDLILDTIGDITVATKNEYPTLDKKVNGSENTTADMGAILPFTIDVKIPEDAVGEIVVHDKMTGLVYQEMTAVSGINVTSTGLNDGCSVHFTLTAEYVKSNRGKTISFTYTAKVTADAANNEAWLTDDTYTSNKDGGDVEVLSTDIAITKVDKTNNATKLAGAEFVLKNGADKFYRVDAQGNVTWVATQAEATVKTTDVNGAAEFENIANGTYYLVEIKAPTGYNLLTDPVEVVVTASKDDNGNVIDIPATVENSTGSELPSTGGMGTTLFYVVGSLMMATAVVVLVAKKKVAKKKDAAK